MWISRKAFEQTIKERDQAIAKATVLEQQNNNLTVTQGWLVAQFNKLELERAHLLSRFMNIDVPVAQIQQKSSAPDMTKAPSFNDMGDEDAAKLGIDWNPDGTLRYADAK